VSTTEPSPSVSRTTRLAEAGVSPLGFEGIARRIEWAHEQLKSAAWPEGKPGTYQEVLDVLVAKLRDGKTRDAAE
jgi:hypothetical protein